MTFLIDVPATGGRTPVFANTNCSSGPTQCLRPNRPPRQGQPFRRRAAPWSLSRRCPGPSRCSRRRRPSPSHCGRRSRPGPRPSWQRAPADPPFGFRRDLLDAPLLVDWFALEDFEPFLRAEVRRRRAVVEPVLRVPLERRVPERFDRVVFVCGICLLSWIEFALIRSYPPKKATTHISLNVCLSRTLCGDLRKALRAMRSSGADAPASGGRRPWPGPAVTAVWSFRPGRLCGCGRTRLRRGA